MRLVVLLSLLAACCCQAAAREARAADAAEADLAVLPWATVVKDEAGTKTLDEAMAAARSSTEKVERDVFSGGFSGAAFWFVIPLENGGPAPLERLVVFDPTWLDDVRVYLVDTAGRIQSHIGGDMRPFEHRSEFHRQTNFALTVPPGRSTLAVRVATADAFFVGVRLMEPKAFHSLVSTEHAYFGATYGGLLALLLFNFVLVLSSREPAYVAYCALLTAFLLMHWTYNGHAFQWLLGDFPVLPNWGHSVFTYLYCFCGLVFAMVFLELESRLPSAYLWVRRLLYLMGASFVATGVLGGYRAQVISAIVWVVIFSTAAFCLGVMSLQKRNTAAAYYLSASTAGLVGSSITALTVMSIVPHSFVMFRAVDFGMLFDAIMLSLALSARVTQARRLERLRRFFSPAVADQLLKATSRELYRPHQREIVVLFLDLRGYTAFSLKHGADEVMRVLGEFHAAMGELIAQHEATLERFAGDGMMVFLNDPNEIPDPAGKAAQMALQMQERFQELNAMWRGKGYELSMGVGIAQGVATIGAIGFEGRRDYAAIGTVTNLAARLCAEARGGQILVSSVVARNIGKTAAVRPAGELALKGFAEPVPCYELLAPPAAGALETERLAASAAG